LELADQGLHCLTWQSGCDVAPECTSSPECASQRDKDTNVCSFQNENL
jgi:hypothetical protein